jgi:prevent-host-death family protein
MSSTVSVCDARGRFHALLDRVEAGEKIVITRRGRPAAVLAPHVTDAACPVKAIERFRASRLSRAATLHEILNWRDEGRR